MTTTNHLAGSPAGAMRVSGRGWRIGFGIVLILCGLGALMIPEIAALGTTVFLASLLVFGGVCEIAYAIHTRARQDFGWKLTSGILTLLLGFAILVFPLVGAVSLGLLVGSFLFVGGIARTILSLRMRPSPRWGWVLFDGLLSVTLALLILIGWPGTSLIVIGVLTGFWLISAGMWRIVLS
jgi:uncharacterized membrane protein HdeD (DUF308 family)